MVNYDVISVPSSSDGCVDIEALKAVLAKEGEKYRRFDVN